MERPKSSGARWLHRAPLVHGTPSTADLRVSPLRPCQAMKVSGCSRSSIIAIGCRAMKHQLTFLLNRRNVERTARLGLKPTNAQPVILGKLAPDVEPVRQQVFQ